MKNKITPDELKRRIIGRKKEMDYDEQLIEKHHLFLKNYGWISLEEFKNLPIITVENLLVKLDRDWKNEQEELKKINKVTHK